MFCLFVCLFVCFFLLLVCLENYCEGDKIKILPCLHKYHEDCVDSWFKMSRKCPICNMDVTQGM